MPSSHSLSNFLASLLCSLAPPHLPSVASIFYPSLCLTLPFSHASPPLSLSPSPPPSTPLSQGVTHQVNRSIAMRQLGAHRFMKVVFLLPQSQPQSHAPAHRHGGGGGGGSSSSSGGGNNSSRGRDKSRIITRNWCLKVCREGIVIGLRRFKFFGEQLTMARAVGAPLSCGFASGSSALLL